jgi:hypothetical protein
MRRLRPADLLAGLGGLVLYGSLFLTWYGFKAPPVRIQTRGSAVTILNTFVGPADSTGWQSFAVSDIVLAAVAALAVSIPLAIALLPQRVSLPVTLAILTSVAGIVAVLLVVAHLIFQPGPDQYVEVRAGAWVGLAGALLVTAGGWLSLADERTPGAVPPTVPRRPAPPS